MNKSIQKIITFGLFPATFFGFLFLAIFALNKGFDKGVLVIGITLITVAIVATFEKIHPQHNNWNQSKNDVKTDSLHALFSFLVLPKLLEGGLRALIFIVILKGTSSTGLGIWPAQLPLIVQLIIAMLVSQFGEYWWHRLAHEIPFLWRFHSVHHSPLRLYWLNAARFHPVDISISFILSLSVLLILGAPNEVLTLFTVWIAMHGLFQHCNIHLKLGFLNYIFSMAELHRWHHSLNLQEANSNYGNNIIFWDLVFGTYFNPKEKEASEHIGLSDLKEFPESYIKQIMAPFQWEKINEQNKKIKGRT